MPARSREAWNDEDIATLWRMIRAGHSLEEAGRKLERSVRSVSAKARRLGMNVRSGR